MRTLAFPNEVVTLPRFAARVVALVYLLRQTVSPIRPETGSFAEVEEACPVSLLSAKSIPLARVSNYNYKIAKNVVNSLVACC